MSSALVRALGALGFLPSPALAALGALCGLIAYPAMGMRRRVVHINLRMLFPDRSFIWRTKTALVHFMLFGRFMLDHGLLLSSSAARIKRLVRVHGSEHLERSSGRGLIIAAPHFLGLELGGIRIGMQQQMDAVYQPQHNEAVEQVLRLCRNRLTPDLVLHAAGSRADLRAAMRRLAAGSMLYYLPDMDFGSRGGQLFLPLLGADAVSTATVLPRIARSTGAKVVGCVSLMRPWGGYDVFITPLWPDQPDEGDNQAMLKFNQFIEVQLRRNPAQYYLMHRRFKTQPAGTPNPYG